MPGNEHHRQQRGDDRQRRDDRRIADLGDTRRWLCLDGAAAHPASRQWRIDVLNHHDGIVDQDANREDQREQADPVDRVAHHPRAANRVEQDRGRDDDENDDAFPPADGDSPSARTIDKGGQRQGGTAARPTFSLGGGAIVAGDLVTSSPSGDQGPDAGPVATSARGRSSATATALAPAYAWRWPCVTAGVVNVRPPLPGIGFMDQARPVVRLGRRPRCRRRP